MRLLIPGISLVLLLFAGGCGGSDDAPGVRARGGAAVQGRRQRRNQPPKPVNDADRSEAAAGKETENAAEQRTRNSSGMSALSVAVFPATTPTTEPTLVIGSPAPSLAGLDVVPGDSLTDAADSRLLIVHFWSPANLLSRQSVKFLSELQREFTEQVRLVHVTTDDSEAITEFLRSSDLTAGRPFAELTDGVFATDGGRRLTREWLGAAGASMLPTAFLVGTDGVLQWFGSALSAERPLRAVLGGTWNLSTAAVSAKSREEITQGILQNSTSNLPGRARKLLEADPENPESSIILIDLLLAAERYRDLESAAAQAMQSCGDDPEALNSLAWLLVSASDSPRVPLDTALLAATRAVQLSGRRSEMLETLARVHFRRRSIREAVTIQREAVAGAALPRRPLLEAILRDYEQAER